MQLPADAKPAIALTQAIRQGETDSLRRTLASNPSLAKAVLLNDRGEGRSLLHIAADWPGHFPNVGETIAILVEAGADPNAAFQGPHAETPLHSAASNNDVEAVDALLDAGANIEAPGAIFTGGAPMSDAVIFAQWRAARRLLERGAKTTLTQSAALGLLDRVDQALEFSPTTDEITGALWHACRGGQLAVAQRLLRHGANLNWLGWDKKTPLDVAVESESERLIAWLKDQGAKRASGLQ